MYRKGRQGGEGTHPNVPGAVDGLLTVPREHPLEIRLLSARAAGHAQGLHPSEALRVREAGGRGEGPVVLVVPSVALRLKRHHEQRKTNKNETEQKQNETENEF